MNINISDGVSPEFLRIADQVKRPKTLLQAGAKGVQVALKKKLKELQAIGNVKGWPSQKFFAGGKNSVEKNVGIVSVTEEKAVIDIADVRFAHHVKGGTVRAKRSKYLTIPLTAEAYAMSGKGTLKESWPELKLFYGKNGTLFLGIREGKTVVFHFVLKTQVTHRAHPNSLPTQEVIVKSAEDAMRKVADLLLRAERR